MLNRGSLAVLGISEYGLRIWSVFKNDPEKEGWSRPWSLYVLKRWCDINGVTI